MLPKDSMCPHCGELTLTHAQRWPYAAVCPGTHQNPRNPETDKRPLWKDLPAK